MIGALVGYFGAGAVVRSLRAIGWLGFSAICVIHLVVISLEGIAWRLLVPAARVWAFIWGRLIRDAGSEVLPVSQMGGCVLGARAVALAGVPGSIAAATTMVDLTLEFLAKLAYMAIGLILLIDLRPGMPVSLPVTLGLAVTGLFAIAFVVLQRHGFAIFDRFARMLGRGWTERTLSSAAAIHAALAQTYQRSAGLWGGFSLHLGSWMLSAVEVWIALRLAGAPLGFPTVLVIEFALCNPNGRLCDPQRRWCAGRSVCTNRRRVRADTGNGSRDLALEAGARPCDRSARARDVANCRGPALVATQHISFRSEPVPVKRS